MFMYYCIMSYIFVNNQKIAMARQKKLTTGSIKDPEDISFRVFQ